jgi:hypothetical protein
VDVRQIASFVKSGVGGADIIICLAATGYQCSGHRQPGPGGFRTAPSTDQIKLHLAVAQHQRRIVLSTINIDFTWPTSTVTSCGPSHAHR